MLAYRFGPTWGYGDFTYRMRAPFLPDVSFNIQAVRDRLPDYVALQQKRGPLGLPVLLFEGSDHLEIEAGLLELLDAKVRPDRDETVCMGLLDDFAEEMRNQQELITTRVVGELREPGKLRQGDSNKDAWLPDSDAVWMIPGVLSSRIPLKQANARCEAALVQWAEPFSTFAAWQGLPYPTGFLRTAWRHLLANHAHDSICCCSIDQVHRDMQYRFEQAEQIGNRVARAALESIAQAAVSEATKADSAAPHYVALFNASATSVEHPVDFMVELDEQWPTFNEFFGFESKPAFTLEDETGAVLPYQRLGQTSLQQRARITPRKFPQGYRVNCVRVAAPLTIPAFGFRLLRVRPADHPTRYGGPNLVCGPRAMENAYLRVDVTTGGLLRITDKRTGQSYDQLLELEDHADIGDGWYHGVALNDRVYHSGALAANVCVQTDGPYLATLRIELEWPLPARFDFQAMRREDEAQCLRIVHEVSLRADQARVEIETRVENTIEDHRLRVLFPSGAQTDSYWADGAFDAVRRPIALNPEHLSWRELEVDTKPQHMWTAVCGAGRGLAVVYTGLPESAVLDNPHRPIALTLLRGFKKTVFTNGEPGGQILGTHAFRYWLVPLEEEPNPVALSRLGQQLAAGVRALQLPAAGHVEVPALAVSVNGQGPVRYGHSHAEMNDALPPRHSLLAVEGEVVVSAVKQDDAGRLVVRLFNPAEQASGCQLKPAKPLKQAWLANLEEIPQTALAVQNGQAGVSVPPHGIVTLLLE